MAKELEIQETRKIVTLEQAITKGTEALIPFEFEYPNTDLTVEVGLKPLTFDSLPSTRMSEEDLAITIVEKAMFNPDGSEISADIVKKIPIGVMKKISDRITEISGFNLDDVKVDQLKNFP